MARGPGLRAPERPGGGVRPRGARRARPPPALAGDRSTALHDTGSRGSLPGANGSLRRLHVNGARTPARTHPGTFAPCGSGIPSARSRHPERVRSPGSRSNSHVPHTAHRPRATRAGSSRQGAERRPPVTALVPTLPAGEQVAAREDWLREVRRGLQTEVITNSHALFEATGPRTSGPRSRGSSTATSAPTRWPSRATSASGWSTRSWPRSRASGRSSRSSTTRRSPRSWSTARTTSTSSGGARSSASARRSSTTTTSCGSSTGSSRRWAGASTRPARGSTPACPTARASTASSSRCR